MIDKLLSPFLGSLTGGIASNFFRSSPESYVAVAEPIIVKQSASMFQNAFYGIGTGYLLNKALKKIYTPLPIKSNFLSNASLALGGGLTALLGMKYIDNIQNNQANQLKQEQKK